ncbi:hypothetical protein [Acinetobacter pittii]|uniref:hypothetical protein n=1 Tax=Acinetobacter pittii TaxID=48296 RepID=UPI0005CA3F09|nr:hypothetical protein [Acinetobacter pittii]MCG9496951.1 hypothetical protein [Acinetobacter pittii]
MAIPDKNDLIGSAVTESQFKLNLGAIVDFLRYVENQSLTIGSNIFDKSTATAGKYVIYTSGTLGNNSSFYASDFCEVSPSTEYRLPAGYNQQFAFYDANKVYISGIVDASSTSKFTTPSNAKYVRFTVSNASVSTFMVCKSSEYPADYVPYVLQKKNLTVDADLIKNLPTKIKEWLGFSSVNIVDTAKVVAGKYVNYLNGELGVNSTFVVAGPYLVKPSTLYKVSSNYNQQFAFYDENMVYISGLAAPDANKQFTTPANAKFAKFSIQSSILSAVVIAENSIFPADYVPYAVNIKDFQLTASQIQNNVNEIKSALGFKIINIIDTAKVTQDKYIDYRNGNVGTNTDFVATDYIEVKPNTEYQVSSFYNQQFAFFDAAFVYISGSATPDSSKKITTPANAKYVRFSIPKSQLSTVVVAESSYFPSSYVSHDVRIAENLMIGDRDVKTTEILTSADTSDTSAAFVGKNAVQLALNSITDATDKKRYTIRTKGLHKVNVASDVIGYPGYPSMILAKNHVDIIGDGKTVFWCELPYDDAAIGPSANGSTYPRTQYQTLYSYAKDCLIKDVTFVVVNARYALHLDNSLGANVTHKFEGVSFIFKGDKGSKQALGIGTSTGEQIYFIGGGSHSDSGQPLYCHNNSKFAKPSLMSFNGHKLSSNTDKRIARIESDGSLVNDKMEFIGCSFGGTAYVIEYGELWLRANPAQNYDSFNHAEWQLTGYGNEPFLFDNKVNGYCLRFKTNATGSGNTIRFDKTSSAYPLLIKNNQANTDVSLYVDSRDYIDGYVVQDGTLGLAAQAFGCKDLSETAAFADANVVYTSMGKRLGDCSTINKTLGVIINGVTSTVTFNKNYTSMSNAAILAEINAALTGATVDLYSYGRDYYPMMTDVAETVYNNGATYIPKGSVVTKSQGTVKLANGNDKVFGVALDDIPVMTTTAEGLKKGQGRVLKRGYIYADQTKAHFVLADNQNPAIGTKFSVNNGQLITDPSGRISVDIDVGVISINC